MCDITRCSIPIERGQQRTPSREKKGMRDRFVRGRAGSWSAAPKAVIPPDEGDWGGRAQRGGGDCEGYRMRMPWLDSTRVDPGWRQRPRNGELQWTSLLRYLPRRFVSLSLSASPGTRKPGSREQRSVRTPPRTSSWLERRMMTGNNEENRREFSDSKFISFTARIKLIVALATMIWTGAGLTISWFYNA